MTLVLASGSLTRAQMLRAAGIPHEILPARVDEEALRAALDAEGVSPRDQSAELADFKTARIAARHPDRVVLGADQILEFQGAALGKSDTPEAAAELLARMAGQTHQLHSAAVLYRRNRPTWRAVETVRLTMRPLSPGFIHDYLGRNWDRVRGSVGAYRIEEEGVRLFTRIEGSHFAVLGLPLLPLIDHLTVTGDLSA